MITSMDRSLSEWSVFYKCRNALQSKYMTISWYGAFKIFTPHPVLVTVWITCGGSFDVKGERVSGIYVPIFQLLTTSGVKLYECWNNSQTAWFSRYLHLTLFFHLYSHDTFLIWGFQNIYTSPYSCDCVDYMWWKFQCQGGEGIRNLCFYISTAHNLRGKVVQVLG